MDIMGSIEFYVVPYAMNVAGALLLLLGAWILSGWLRRRVANALGKAKFDATLAKFFSNMVRWIILLLALLACLSIFGIETTGFAAVIGGASLAIGLAFQGTLSHLAAGTMLLIFRPFKVGDVIKVNGFVGKVNEIELFTTTLDTPDNRRIIVPNGQVFGTTIENVTFHDTRRVDVAVGTDYGADLDEVRAVLSKAAKEVEGVLEDPPIQIFLDSLGASSIDWQVRVWVKTSDFWDVKDKLTRAVKVALDEAEIGIPFPQMDVHHVTELKVERDAS